MYGSVNVSEDSAKVIPVTLSLLLLTSKLVNPKVVISAVLVDITAVCLCCNPIYPVPVVALTTMRSVGICKNVGIFCLL